jgi:hypothetical protein
MFNWPHPAGRDQLCDLSQTLQEELSRMEWLGKQVYHMPAHNTLASQAIINKLMPLLPKDSEEVNLQVRQLHAMVEATTMMDPTLNPGVGR